MSKRSDDDADFEAGMTTSERRRRRRRAGIRIPSDNVPRRNTGAVPVTPVPEDPALAVSLAYAFTDDGRGPNSLPPEALAVDGLADEVLDDEASGDGPRAPDHLAATPRSPADLAGGPQGLDPLAPDELGPDELAPDELGPDELGPEQLSSDDLTAGLDDATTIGEAPIPTAIDDVVPDGRTRQMPVVSLEALGLTGLDSDAPVAAEADDVTAAAATAPVGDDPTRTTAEVEAVDIDVDEPVIADGVPRRPMPRAATVALSEDDLEELMEVAGMGAGARSKPNTAPPLPPPERPRQTLPPLPPPGAAATPEPVPVAAADPSDSGEIMAEEILEVDDAHRAAAAAVTAPMTIAASGPISTSTGAAPPPPPTAPKPPRAPAPAKKPLPAASADDKRKRRGRPWFEDVFDEDYLRTLPFLTPQATQAEASMVVDSLGLTAGAAVLDLGCGYGRHAMELAARGLNVVGVDLSLPMLLRGADEAQRRGLDINFVHVDMREIDFDAQFDGAYCLFSTFGFFDDETNKKTASLVAKALKPGAKFMLEVLNRDYVIGDLPTRVWWEGDGCVVLEEVEFNYFSSRVQSKRSVVFDDGRQVEQEISLRVYSLHEIGKLLHAAGLRVLEVSGSMATKGRFLGNRSREIIVIAERRADAAKST